MGELSVSEIHVAQPGRLKVSSAVSNKQHIAIVWYKLPSLRQILDNSSDNK